MCLTPFYAGRDAALPLLQKSRGENKHQAALYESISCASNGTRFDQSNPSFDKYIPSFKLLCFAPPFTSLPLPRFSSVPWDSPHGLSSCSGAGPFFQRFPMPSCWRLIEECAFKSFPPNVESVPQLLGWTPNSSHLGYGHVKLFFKFY